MNLKEIVDICTTLSLDGDQLLVLLSVKEKQANLTNKIKNNILNSLYFEELYSNLENAGYIKNGSLSGKAAEYFRQGNKFEDFVSTYRQLFKETGKLGAMGNKAGCEKKMRKFVSDNPQWSFDHILKAAQAYIDSVSELRYLQQADYVVEKNGSSRLATFCEELEERSLSEDDDFTIKA